MVQTMGQRTESTTYLIEARHELLVREQQALHRTH